MLQAIGAQATFRKRQVVSLSGDGGVTMMMGEFVTLIQTGLPVKVVVLSNGTLVGCKNPNFAAMAVAIGIKAIRVEQPQDLKAGLAEILAHDGPALLDVVSARQELIMPPVTTLEEAHHFGVFMMAPCWMDAAGSLSNSQRRT